MVQRQQNTLLLVLPVLQYNKGVRFSQENSMGEMPIRSLYACPVCAGDSLIVCYTIGNILAALSCFVPVKRVSRTNCLT